MKVFLDTSCWFAALHSPSGGSAKLINLAFKYSKISIYLTLDVVQEVTEKINEKMSPSATKQFLTIIQNKNFTITDFVTKEEIELWRRLTSDEDDLHILAGAYITKSDYLVSLDKKHLLTETVKKNFPIPVLDTKDFFKEKKIIDLISF